MRDGEVWKLDDRFDSIGCETNELVYGLYENIPALEPIQADFESLLARVFSGVDPFLIGSHETGGTFEFGQTQGYWAYTGIGLIIIGLMLIIQPITYIKKKCLFGYVPGQLWRDKEYAKPGSY